jgi:hypothetical protein
MFVIDKLTKFNQHFVYNIDCVSLKDFIKDIAERRKYIHNIDTPIEEQQLPIDTHLNYIKVIEPFYGNVIIEIGIFIYNYKTDNDLPIIDTKLYSIEMIQYDLAYHYKVKLQINCNNDTTNNIKNKITNYLFENSY